MSEPRQPGANLTAKEKRALLAELTHKKAQERRSFPLSFAQQRMWFLSQLEPESPFYNILRAVSLTGSVDSMALERSLNEIVTRHEALRTIFAMQRGEPVQVISPGLALSIALTDLSQLPDEEMRAEVVGRASEEAHLPFDLSRGPLLRARLFKLGDRDHILLVSMHHIISDGWSIVLLFKELSALYNALTLGLPSPLEELPIQYADYAVWQRDYVQGTALERDLVYWREQLDGAPAKIELPTDRPRPAVQSYRGARLSFELDSKLTEGIKHIARQQVVTPFMLLLAAFKVLLHRYSGQSDIVVGTPVANRNREEIEGLIGFFVNSLVLRSDLSDDPPFDEVLHRVKEVALGAYSHQELPFDKLVEHLQPERSLSHNPLFQIIFVLQNAPPPDLTLPRLSVRPVSVASQVAIGDLTVSIDDRPEGFLAEIQYSTDLFDDTTIQRMAKHFQVILEAILVEPQQRISRLRLLSNPERELQLHRWNATTTPYPKDLCIHDLFEAQARRTLDATALVVDGLQVSYGELNRRANQLAQLLGSLGAGPESVVGICMERSAEMIVSLLAVLKAGAAYLPLDAEYPKERLAFMIDDAGPVVLLSQESIAGQLPPSAVRVIRVDGDRELIAGQTGERPASGAAPDNLAYVIYTSGSTGKPKGVTITHRNVVRLVKQTNYAGFDPEDVFVQCAPISFDASTFEIWGSLLNGARLVVMPASTPSLRELGALIETSQATTVWLTAGLFRLMADEQLQALRSLRQLLAGGDVLSAPHVRKVLKELPRCNLINGYGPTESTTFACCHTATSASQSKHTIPIGRPIANTRAYPLGERLELLAVGVAGELFIAGDGLARSYLNRPGLTAEKFIPDGLGGEPGGRLYRTGDRARYLADGEIAFLGRQDNQVKIRGFRIELDEIKAALGRHPSIEDALVIARADEAGEKILVAYVVASQGNTLTPSQLRNYLKDRLPQYMIPSACVTIDAIPLASNGKVDYAALPALDLCRYESSEDHVPPRNPREKLVAEIWSDLLNIERIGIHDNFFELGGHSLLAIQFVSRARESLQVELPVRSLFENPTVAAISEALIRTERTVEAQRLPIRPIVRQPRTVGQTP